MTDFIRTFFGQSSRLRPCSEEKPTAFRGSVGLFASEEVVHDTTAKAKE
jgi:hypothetical protein